MEPKDKAKELVELYFDTNGGDWGGWGFGHAKKFGLLSFKNAKKSALVAVNEILHLVARKNLKKHGSNYWSSVKQEIEIL